MKIMKSVLALVLFTAVTTGCVSSQRRNVQDYDPATGRLTHNDTTRSFALVGRAPTDGGSDRTFIRYYDESGGYLGGYGYGIGYAPVYSGGGYGYQPVYSGGGYGYGGYAPLYYAEPHNPYPFGPHGDGHHR